MADKYKPTNTMLPRPNSSYHKKSPKPSSLAAQAKKAAALAKNSSQKTSQTSQRSKTANPNDDSRRKQVYTTDTSALQKNSIRKTSCSGQVSILSISERHLVGGRNG